MRVGGSIGDAELLLLVIIVIMRNEFLLGNESINIKYGKFCSSLHIYFLLFFFPLTSRRY